MSRIFCVIDGMTHPGFDPARYPALSRLRLQGMAETVPPGHAAESLPCILTLLGMRNVPKNLRGCAEALGAGLPAGENDLILRASWVKLDEWGIATGLADAPKEFPAPGVRYHPLGGYKALLLLPGEADALPGIVTHAPYAYLGRPFSELLPSGSAALRNAVERSRTKGRAMLPWGQSKMASLPPFPERAAAVCGANLARGAARLLGMAIIPVSGATGDTDTDLFAKAEAALQAAEEYPFVFLHVNGADEAAHRKDAAEKERFLLSVNETLLRPLLDSPHALTVTADHGTDPATGLHTGGPQPMFVKDGTL